MPEAYANQNWRITQICREKHPPSSINESETSQRSSTSFLPELTLCQRFSTFKLSNLSRLESEPVDFAARGTNFQLSSSQHKCVAHVELPSYQLAFNILLVKKPLMTFCGRSGMEVLSEIQEQMFRAQIVCSRIA